MESVDFLGQLVGPIAEFHIVIDSNILIREIIWAGKRERAAARTMLHECIVAGTIIAYVTPTIVSEVEEHLTSVAVKYKLSPAQCLAEWAIYKQMLHVREPDHASLEKYVGGQDPDDAPTLALADMLGAFGILTRDSDILAMGGNCIPVGFVVRARDYSRKTTVSLSIQIGGYYVSIGAIQAFLLVVSALRHGVSLFRGLPPQIKIFAFMVLAFIAAYPKSRYLAISSLKALRRGLPDALPRQILQTILYLADMAADNYALPPTIPITEQL